jgi:hypothetical protein
MISIYAAALVLLLVAALFVALFVTLFRRSSGGSPPGVSWLDDFSLDKYRPLDRLFDSADLQFAAAHPGYTASLGRKLASARRAAARLFLAELTIDVDRMVAIGREMLAASHHDRPDLAATLFRQWLAFHLRVFSLRVQLRLAPFGFAPRRSAGLLDALTRMRNLVELLDVSAQARA